MNDKSKCTIKRLNQNTFIISVTIPAKGGSFGHIEKIQVGGELIFDDRLFTIKDVDEAHESSSNLSFRVTV